MNIKVKMKTKENKMIEALALPEHVVVVVGACAVAGAIFVFGRSPANE